MSASRTVRRIAATALAAGSVVAAAAMPASADSDHGYGHGYRHGRHHSYSNVVLGDIQYNSPGRDDWSNRSLNREWVEVTNTGRRAVDLDGWTLSDRDGNRYRFDDLRLPGYATVRVHTGHGYNTRRDVYQGSWDYIWGNYTDKATLRDDDGRTVDTQSWGYRR
ncbi:lamin tail domain-containing protein [Streptomyces sp. NPDC048411]|uniref:lamin tail domain-containing protein n=1 Tax=Streptomyces sp. NPDC048411 TaxID=3157206 RepID=UPI003452599E